MRAVVFMFKRIPWKAQIVAPSQFLLSLRIYRSNKFSDDVMLL